MKKMNVVLVIVGVCILTLGIILCYFNAFKTIECTIVEEGGEIIVYESRVGDYKQSGEVMDRVYKTLIDSFGLQTYKGFGLYYDNPKEVETSQLRSDVGCILEDKDFARIPDIEREMAVSVIPKQQYIVAEFPYKGQLSVLFGIFKVYPALSEYVEQNGYRSDTPVIEIYDVPNKKIVYRKAVHK